MTKYLFHIHSGYHLPISLYRNLYLCIRLWFWLRGASLYGTYRNSIWWEQSRQSTSLKQLEYMSILQKLLMQLEINLLTFMCVESIDLHELLIVLIAFLVGNGCRHYPIIQSKEYFLNNFDMERATAATFIVSFQLNQKFSIGCIIYTLHLHCCLTTAECHLQ